MQTYSGLVQLIKSTRAKRIKIVKIHLGVNRYRDVWAKEIGEGLPIPSNIEGVPIVEDKGEAEYFMAVFYDFNSSAGGKGVPSPPPMPR